MHDAERDPVPLPLFAGEALRRRHMQALGLAARDRRTGKRGEQRGDAASVVVVAMADDYAIEPRDTDRMQRGYHGRIAEIETGWKARTGVVDQDVVARTHDEGQALPHVEHQR